MPKRYADIAFPTAVRRLFTYELLQDVHLEPGMRVQVPLRNEVVIGMAVRLHGNEPDFETRPVLHVLDREPVVSSVLLELTGWMHRFYYCSWGEAIQAALPAGLNFLSEKMLRVRPESGRPTDGRERQMLNEINAAPLSLREARNRWRDRADNSRLKRLMQNGWVEVWESPKLPPGRATVKQWFWADGVDRKRIGQVIDNERSYKWTEALKRLAELKLPEAETVLIKEKRISRYALGRIEQEGLILAKEVPVEADSGRVYGEHRPGEIKELSDEQKPVSGQILEALKRGGYSSFLLYGVTGSGKTEIYIHALKSSLSMGKGGMILVPEIALTPQTVDRFYRIFGDTIAVLHSRLSDRERYEAWKGLHEGRKRVVIGPRSAVFAPLRDPGVIIVDEEHDNSYKQFDPAPRYHARDVAIMRANMEGAVVVMGSATPSLVTLRAATRGKHTLLTLPSRPVGKLPEVKVLDLRKYRSAMRGPLTVALYEAIQEALGRQEQIILLYNRRGYSSFLVCEECGHVPRSPESSVTLTWHKQRDLLICHYSGYTRRTDSRCEACGSTELTAMGSGTQQIEDEIRPLFPDARVLRMDRDTTSGRDAHRRIYESFLAGEADILIGTQLVSKGLDFPGVTVVGVLNAETELAFPSFRAGERMFQLLSQVAGRAGRGAAGGAVYVQTWRPEHRSIRYAAMHDFESFAREELAERQKLAYPPYSRMVVFHFKGKSREQTERVAGLFTDAMRSKTSDSAVLGPSPSIIEQISGLWQWESSLKLHAFRNDRDIERLLDSVFRRYEKIKPRGIGSVRITVDVDAVE